jgi:PAS domain-containing protein
VIPIRTRLTLVVVFATLAGALVGWLLRHYSIASGPFLGGVGAAAIGAFMLSRLLVSDPATSILQAVSDGLLSFSEREYGMRLAAPSSDEPLINLVRRFNKLGEVLRTEHNDRYQREILLETVLETTAMAVVLCNEALRIVYANGAARDLFGGARRRPPRSGKRSNRRPTRSSAWRRRLRRARTPTPARRARPRRTTSRAVTSSSACSRTSSSS